MEGRKIPSRHESLRVLGFHLQVLCCLHSRELLHQEWMHSQPSMNCFNFENRIRAGLLGELNQASLTRNGFDVHIGESAAKKDWASKIMNDQELNSVQRVAEANTHQHFMGYCNDLPLSSPSRGRFLFDVTNSGYPFGRALLKVAFNAEPVDYDRHDRHQESYLGLRSDGTGDFVLKSRQQKAVRLMLHAWREPANGVPLLFFLIIWR